MQLGFQGLEGWSRDKNEKEGQANGWRDQEGLCICVQRLVMSGQERTDNYTQGHSRDLILQKAERVPPLLIPQPHSHRI